MKKETVEKIVEVTKDVGDLLNEIRPKNNAEWEAHDKLTAAHKQLRGIEILGLEDEERRASPTR